MRRRRALQGVAVVVAMAIGHLLTSQLSVGQVSSESFVRSAAPAATAHLSYADVRVEDVRGAALLAPADPSALAVAAGGAFVVVTVAVRPTREPTTFFTVLLVDEQGRRHQPSVRSTCPAAPAADTGVATHAMICFDVAPDAVRGSHLLVARGQQVSDSLRRDDVADLDLGIDAGRAATIVGATESLRVQQASTTPIKPVTVTVTGS